MATYQMPPQNNSKNNYSGGAIDYDQRSREALPKPAISNSTKPMTQMETWLDDVGNSIWVNVIRPALGQTLMNVAMTFTSQIASTIFGVKGSATNDWTNYSGYGRPYNSQGRPSDNLRNRQFGVSREDAFGMDNGDYPRKREIVNLYGDDWRRVIRFQHKAYADKVLADMKMKIAQNGYTTVGSYIDSASYYDSERQYKFDDILHAWGWTDLTEADVRYSVLYRNRPYEIVLPQEEAINKYR